MIGSLLIGAYMLGSSGITAAAGVPEPPDLGPDLRWIAWDQSAPGPLGGRFLLTGTTYGVVCSTPGRYLAKSVIYVAPTTLVYERLNARVGALDWTPSTVDATSAAAAVPAASLTQALITGTTYAVLHNDAGRYRATTVRAGSGLIGRYRNLTSVRIEPWRISTFAVRETPTIVYSKAKWFVKNTPRVRWWSEHYCECEAIYTVSSNAAAPTAPYTKETLIAGSGGSGTSPHRYWRLNITATAGTYCAMAEIEMRDVVGGADLTGSGTASASAAFGGWPASQAVDNNTSTGWTSYTSPAPQWWAYDFGAGVTKAIIELRITPRQDGFHTESPTSFDFQYSDDGSTWTTQKTVTGLSWTSAAQTIDVSASSGTPAVYGVLALNAGLRLRQSFTFDNCSETYHTAIRDVRGTPDWPQITLSAFLKVASAVPASPLARSLLTGTTYGVLHIDAGRYIKVQGRGASPLGRYLYLSVVGDKCPTPDAVSFEVRCKARVRWSAEGSVVPVLDWDVVNIPTVRWSTADLAISPGWKVQQVTRVRWQESASNLWTVEEIPQVRWAGVIVSPGTVLWTVEETPTVRWLVAPGSTPGDCLTGDGIPPPLPTEEDNYVF